MAHVVHKGPPKPLFTSLHEGMQQMVDTLIARLNPEWIRMRHPHSSHLSRGRRRRVSIEMNGDERYDAVILATPANVAGELLDPVDHELARNLLSITLQLIGHGDAWILQRSAGEAAAGIRLPHPAQ